MTTGCRSSRWPEAAPGKGIWRQPIAAGVYRTTNGDRIEIEKVTLLPNGLTKIGDGDDKSLYGFAPLDRENRRFVAWFRKDGLK